MVNSSISQNKGAIPSSRLIAAVTGAISALLGATVLIGWHTNNLTLLQLHTSFVAMVYNTALGFLICGIAVTFIAFNKPKFALIGGIYGTALGTLTLIQYVFHFGLGIDQVFMRAYTSVANTYPGRPAINTAFCFVLIGISLLILSFNRHFQYQQLIVSIIGSIITALGIIAFSGYLTGITSAYAWGNITRMAVHTALGISVIGIGLIACVWNVKSKKEINKLYLVPSLLAISVITGTLCLWQALIVEQRIQIERAIKHETVNVRFKLTKQIGSHVVALIRIAERWRKHGQPEKEDWEFDTGLSFKHSNHFLAIAWIDPLYQVRWVVPQNGNDTDLNFYLVSNERRLRALQKAKYLSSVTMTETFELSQGGKGFHVYVPIINDDAIEGYIAGVFRVRGMVDEALKDELETYSINILDDEKIVYQSNATDNTYKTWKQEEPFSLYHTNWQIQLWPKHKAFYNLNSYVDEATLIIGLFISIILPLVTYQSKIARLREKALHITNQALEREMLERENTEKALRESQRALSTLMSNLPGMAYRCLNDKGWTMELVSEGCLELTGYSTNELIGNKRISYGEIIHKDDQEKVWEGVQQAIQQKRSFELIYRIITANGKEKWVWEKGSGIFSSDEQLLAIEGFITDITDRKKIEEELKRSNKDLEQFAYVASHDLQEPLRMVTSYTQLLAHRYKSKLDTDANDFIDYAVDGATRMQQLIKDLLSYSRVGAELKNVELVNCDEVCSQTIINLKSIIEDKKATITQDSLPVVAGNKTQLGQLFQNLISNGIKYNCADQPLVHVSAVKDQDKWLFSIQDNGIGIDPQYSERIFVIFQRLHTKKEYSGTGIGLALCKKIVEQHGGRIWVESEPAKGSTFYFTIPEQ